MWDLASNYTGTMIGYHAVPVIVDAYMKGYRNFDAKEAYKACLRAAEYDTTGIKCPDLVLPHLMPKAKYYKNAIGYIPCDRENESVAKALEYAYDDWCISIFAEAMSDFESKAKYERFAKAYEFYFDKSIRFMRGLDSKGEWRTPFNPRASTHRSDDYCEGTAWQWTWFVPHDVEGLVNLMGGEDAFVQKLDSLFSADSSLEGETTSSDISGLIGQYAHGNEPSHHVIHLYNYVIISPWALVPALIMLILPLLRVPIRRAMAISAAAAFVITVTVQGGSVADALRIMVVGYHPTEGLLASVVSGGGLVSMLTPFLMIPLAALYTGILEGTGALTQAQSVLEWSAERIGRFPTMILLSLLAAMVLCNQTIVVMMEHQLIGAVYAKDGAEHEELAMDIANSGVTIAGLIPWCIACAVPLSMLGVGVEALPYACLLYLIPLCYLFTKRFFFPAKSKGSETPV